MIDAYYNRELAGEKQQEFEQRIAGDPLFADEVAFYLSAKQLAASEMEKKRAELRQVFEEYKKKEFYSKPQQGLLRKILPWVAAAAVVAAIFWGINILKQPASPDKLADKYIVENLQVLSVMMSNKQDNLQTGLNLYNEGKITEAQKQFESIMQSDTSSFDAKKYAGIIALRLKQYDKALALFVQIENYTQLYANPGKFYHALTLMKRNQPGDKQQAMALLKAIVNNDLEGKKEAQNWLKKM